jgi:hypothetical protein
MEHESAYSSSSSSSSSSSTSSSSSLAKEPFLSYSLAQMVLPDHSLFTALDFAIIISLTEQGREPRVQPPSGGSDLCIYVHDDGVAHLYPQAPSSLFFVFYDSQGFGGGILTRLHVGRKLIIVLQRAH